MLILTRRLNETVMIGNDVKVHVLGFKGAQVRLGIEAPSNVDIDREEVRARKKEEAERLASPESLPSAATAEASAGYPREAHFQNVEDSPIPHRAVG